VLQTSSRTPNWLQEMERKFRSAGEMEAVVWVPGVPGMPGRSRSRGTWAALHRHSTNAVFTEMGQQRLSAHRPPRCLKSLVEFPPDLEKRLKFDIWRLNILRVIPFTFTTGRRADTGTSSDSTDEQPGRLLPLQPGNGHGVWFQCPFFSSSRSVAGLRQASICARL